MHQREAGHHEVHHLHRDVHPGPAGIRFDTHLRRQREGFVALPVGDGAECRRRGEQVVQVRGAGAGQPGDHHGRREFDVVDFRVPGQQVGEQQPVLQPLQQLGVEIDDADVIQAGNILQRSEIHVEAFAVVVRAEIVEAGLGGGLGMQHIGVERAIRRHRSHHLPQRFGLG